MARAKRHYIPGQIWHLTHRCHKREFLLKLVMDRRKWVQWLFEAKTRYGLVILNYAVTSNHIHLLVLDEKGRDVIPDSIKPKTSAFILGGKLTGTLIKNT